MKGGNCRFLCCRECDLNDWERNDSGGSICCFIVERRSLRDIGFSGAILEFFVSFWQSWSDFWFRSELLVKFISEERGTEEWVVVSKFGFKLIPVCVNATHKMRRFKLKFTRWKIDWFMGFWLWVCGTCVLESSLCGSEFSVFSVCKALRLRSGRFCNVERWFGG